MRAILREKNDEIENLETMVRASRPHLHRDWAHPAHICTGTGLTPATSAPGPGLTPATSAPGLGSPLPHPRRSWAHPGHIRAGAGAALDCRIRAA